MFTFHINLFHSCTSFTEKEHIIFIAESKQNAVASLQNNKDRHKCNQCQRSSETLINYNDNGGNNRVV